MAEAAAWLLNLGAGIQVAIGLRELQHLLPQPVDWVAVPRTPHYCRYALWWDERIVPVMDLERWLLPEQSMSVKPLLGIVAYQETPTAAVNYGALMLAERPRQIRVEDASECSLSGPTAPFQPIAIAAFRQASRVVPILHLTTIFTTRLSPTG
jgi:hypothetical protein